MRGLRVLLLGPGRLEFDGQPLTRLMAVKQQALVFFLAAGGEPVARTRLAALLWGEMDEAAARANLRAALTRLRRWLPGMLDIDDRQVGFAPGAPLAVDWHELAAALRDGAPASEREAAAALWRGPLLDGLDVVGSDGFERWLTQARQRAQHDALSLRRRLLEDGEAAGAIDAAVAHARGLLEVDDADEPAHMALMRLLAASGRRTAALPAAADAPLAHAVGVDGTALATLRNHAWLQRDGGEALAMHPLQIDHLRRRPEAAAEVAAVRQAGVAHLQAVLPPVEPFGDLPPPARADVLALAARTPALLLSDAVAATGAGGPADAHVQLVDRAVASLAHADRQAEAAALLAGAAERADLPRWQTAGWSLRRGELLNGCGASAAAHRAYQQGLMALGLGDFEPDAAPQTLHAATRIVTRGGRSSGCCCAAWSCSARCCFSSPRRNRWSARACWPMCSRAAAAGRQNARGPA